MEIALVTSKDSDEEARGSIEELQKRCLISCHYRVLKVNADWRENINRK
jgi:hypothetical protein